MKPRRSIVIAVALVGLNLGVSNARAGLVGDFLYGGDGNDILLGDYFTLPPIESSSATELRATIPISNMSGLVQNPLFEEGPQASNPFFGTQTFRVDVNRVKVHFTWDVSGAYTGLEVTTDLLAYDPLSPTGPFLSLSAIGTGIKTPPPPPRDTINGGSEDDIILGDYIVPFNPDQPWLEPNGDPSASYRFASGTFDFVVAVPEPASCLGLIASALLLQRSRRN